MSVVGVNDEMAVPVGEHALRRAFEDVYRESYVAVLRVATAVTGDRGVAAEVTQEAFMAARQRWNTVGNYDRPDFWVRRVAINRALSARRRAVREARALVRLGGRRDRVDIGDPATDEVWGHVRRLPRRQAALVALVYLDDLSVEQAANALGIAVPTAKTHLQRARRALAVVLKEELE